jgi:hypothetical protein
MTPHQQGSRKLAIAIAAAPPPTRSPPINTLTTDPSPSDCGHACHVAVKAKDYIIHPYQKR